MAPKSLTDFRTKAEELGTGTPSHPALRPVHRDRPRPKGWPRQGLEPLSWEAGDPGEETWSRQAEGKEGRRMADREPWALTRGQQGAMPPYKQGRSDRGASWRMACGRA